MARYDAQGNLIRDEVKTLAERFQGVRKNFTDQASRAGQYVRSTVMPRVQSGAQTVRQAVADANFPAQAEAAANAAAERTRVVAAQVRQGLRGARKTIAPMTEQAAAAARDAAAGFRRGGTTVIDKFKPAPIDLGAAEPAAAAEVPFTKVPVRGTLPTMPVTAPPAVAAPAPAVAAPRANSVIGQDLAGGAAKTGLRRSIGGAAGLAGKVSEGVGIASMGIPVAAGAARGLYEATVGDQGFRKGFDTGLGETVDAMRNIPGYDTITPFGDIAMESGINPARDAFRAPVDVNHRFVPKTNEQMRAAAGGDLAAPKEIVPGYNAITQGMQGIRRPGVDYNSPTAAPVVTNETTPQVQFPVNVDGKPAGYFARANPNGPFGVRDISPEDQRVVASGESPNLRDVARRGDNFDGGLRRTGALSVIPSAYGENMTPGMRGLIEDADIRAKRALPRNSSAERIARGNQAATLDVARINAFGRVAAARGALGAATQKAYDNAWKQFHENLNITAPDVPNNDAATQTNREKRGFLNNYFQRSGLLPTADAQQTAEDAYNVDKELRGIGDRQSSVLGPIASHLAEIVLPDFMYKTEDSPTAADPATVTAQMESLNDLFDPKKDSYTWNGKQIPKNPGLVNRIINKEMSPETLEIIKTFMTKKRRALTAQQQPLPGGVDFTQLDGLDSGGE